MTAPNDDVIYIVTDIEADGGVPGEHSMIAFGSVAVTADGERFGEFEAVLRPLDGAGTDPRTMAWWRSQPEAWKAATENPSDPGQIMREFVSWIRAMPRRCVFAAHPIAFDGDWIDYYLRRFTPYALVQPYYDTDKLFLAAGLCLRSFGASILARPVSECEVTAYPAAWLGDEPHTHRAIDDARGYANLLVTLMRLSRERASGNGSG